jgi:cytochrome c-type protein NapB
VPDRPDASRRGVALVAAIVGGVVLIGLVTGTEPTTYRAKRPPVRERTDPGSVPPARTHEELSVRPWGSSPIESGWLESRALAADAAFPEPDAGVTVQGALRERSIRRAYDGAPPVVPHPVSAGGAPECLACHADGFALGMRRASRVPHAEFASCTQCHVASSAAFTELSPNPARSARNTWQGLAAPVTGAVAYPGAPPAVPHATRMRENCESCHGPQGRVALRTPHPERRSCLQCHPAIGERGHARAR